ncbi:MAG: hypothetical protein KGR46_11745, partial [Verrucomicrobia bacterium]|nr:hypothetical protein [Verrucomicrobiota bacterium]
MPEMNEPAHVGDEMQPVEDHRNPRRRGRGGDNTPPEVGILVDPEPRHALDRLVLQPGVTADIDAALRLIETRDQLEAVWNLGEIQPQRGR